MNSLVALPIAAALPVSAPSIASGLPTQADAELDRAAQDLAAIDQAFEDLRREHGYDANFLPLGVRRNENIATLITVPAISGLGFQAKASTLRLDMMVADQDQHQQIAVSLADDLVARGSAGATALALPAVRAAAQAPDAELIELAARFEPLVDQYYVAHRRWSGSLARAHAEHDREFGDPADRNYEYPPEIVAAFSDSCERSGANPAGEALHAIFKEMAPLANAINAAPVTSIEGFRAKALVAFWGVAATGYALPEIGMVEAAPDDDSDDDGEEA